MKTLCPRCNHPTTSGQPYCLSCGRPLANQRPLLPKPKPAKKLKRKRKRNTPITYDNDPTT